MEIKRIGSQPSGKGPADWFTGTVRIDPLFQAPDPALVAGASVTFEPGARTAWHTHPLGQTLIVTAGCGWAQREGGPSMTSAMQMYARARRSRISRVQRTARQNGRIYHLTGPMALARDLAIKAMGPQRMLARQDWIYDWRV